MKAAAIKIWKTYDDTYGYATEKVNRIKDVGNIKDNMMFIFAMFDWMNQSKLMKAISEEAQEAITTRIESVK